LTAATCTSSRPISLAVGIELNIERHRSILVRIAETLDVRRSTRPSSTRRSLVEAIPIMRATVAALTSTRGLSDMCEKLVGVTALTFSEATALSLEAEISGLFGSAETEVVEGSLDSAEAKV
jgi:hypothetical protein